MPKTKTLIALNELVSVRGLALKLCCYIDFCNDVIDWCAIESQDLDLPERDATQRAKAKYDDLAKLSCYTDTSLL